MARKMIHNKTAISVIISTFYDEGGKLKAEIFKDQLQRDIFIAAKQGG